MSSDATMSGVMAIQAVMISAAASEEAMRGAAVREEAMSTRLRRCSSEPSGDGPQGDEHAATSREA